MDEWDQFIDWIRKLFRARLGLPLEDDIYQGLIHTNDNRERTKLSTHNVYRQSYGELLSETGGEEWEVVHNWMEQERHFFISEEGQRATDFIASIARKKEEAVPVTNITMNQPSVEKQEKKHFWQRKES